MLGCWWNTSVQKRTIWTRDCYAYSPPSRNVHPFFVASSARAILSKRNAYFCLFDEPKNSGAKITCEWAGFFGEGL